MPVDRQFDNSPPRADSGQRNLDALMPKQIIDSITVQPEEQQRARKVSALVFPHEMTDFDRLGNITLSSVNVLFDSLIYLARKGMAVKRLDGLGLPVINSGGIWVVQLDRLMAMPISPHHYQLKLAPDINFTTCTGQDGEVKRLSQLRSGCVAQLTGVEMVTNDKIRAAFPENSLAAQSINEEWGCVKKEAFDVLYQTEPTRWVQAQLAQSIIGIDTYRYLHSSRAFELGRIHEKAIHRVSMVHQRGGTTEEAISAAQDAAELVLRKINLSISAQRINASDLIILTQPVKLQYSVENIDLIVPHVKNELNSGGTVTQQVQLLVSEIGKVRKMLDMSDYDRVRDRLTWQLGRLQQLVWEREIGLWDEGQNYGNLIRAAFGVSLRTGLLA